MDTDDSIDPENGRKLRQLVDGLDDFSPMAYVVQVHCPGTAEHGDPDVTVVDHVKLFRNRPDLRFEFRMHEQILPAIRRADGEVAWTDLFIVHSGSDRSVEGQAKKLKRDFQLLALDLAERPDHPFVLFNLGMTHADAAEHDQAVHYLNRCIQVSGSGESHLRKAFALLIGSLSALEQFDEAWKVCLAARRQFPEDAELLFREGILHHHFGRLKEAERSYRCVLENQEERYFTSVDQGLSTYKARHNLALVYEDIGDLRRAEHEWRSILELFPFYKPGCAVSVKSF